MLVCDRTYGGWVLAGGQQEGKKMDIKQEEGEIKWRSQDEGNTVRALSKRSVKEEKEEKKESAVAPKNGVRRKRRSKGTIVCGDRIIL